MCDNDIDDVYDNYNNFDDADVGGVFGGTNDAASFAPVEIDFPFDDKTFKIGYDDNNGADGVHFGSKIECSDCSGSCWLTCSGTCKHSWGGPMN